MKLARLILILSFGVILQTAKGGTPTTWSGTSDIQFSGTSTLHDWSGKVSAEPFVANVSLSDQGAPESVKASVVVKAAKMYTAEAKRDENMRKDMKVTDFPLITGAFDTPINAKGGKAPATLPFTLTLVGKSHKVDAKLSKWTVTNNTATFDLDFDLSLKTCGIKVPSVMFVIRVGDSIHVHTSVKLTRK